MRVLSSVGRSPPEMDGPSVPQKNCLVVSPRHSQTGRRPSLSPQRPACIRAPHAFRRRGSSIRNLGLYRGRSRRGSMESPAGGGEVVSLSNGTSKSLPRMPCCPNQPKFSNATLTAKSSHSWPPGPQRPTRPAAFCETGTRCCKVITRIVPLWHQSRLTQEQLRRPRETT